MSVKVAVLGAKGRMGSTSVAAIEAADTLEVVAAIDVDDEVETAAGADVALVFSTPDVALDHVLWCIERDIAVVVGTSGFDAAAVARIRAAALPTSRVLVVPNFSIGAVLMMRFAAIAAPFFESVEVIEMHHPDKVDAPSGTAVRTAELMADARADASSPALPDATTRDPLGSRGARVGGIPVHSVRARGFTAAQEVLLGGAGEVLSLRHDSSSRESFMPGVVAALLWVVDHSGITVGLDDVLGV